MNVIKLNESVISKKRKCFDFFHYYNFMNILISDVQAFEMVESGSKVCTQINKEISRKLNSQAYKVHHRIRGLIDEKNWSNFPS